MQKDPTVIAIYIMHCTNSFYNDCMCHAQSIYSLDITMKCIILFKAIASAVIDMGWQVS